MAASFRAQLSAAPLKPFHDGGSGEDQNPAFRAQLSAAPLKPKDDLIFRHEKQAIPRSIERGPVEAKSVPHH